MRETGQDAQWGVAVVGVLLLLFVGCTATLDREPATPSVDAWAATPALGDRSQAPSIEPSDSSAQALATDPASAASEHELASAPEFASEDGARAPDDGTLRVEAIHLTERDGRTAVVAQLSQPPDDVQHFTLASPHRLVIDLAGRISPAMRATVTPAVDPDVSAVRVGVHGGKLRIVVDLTDSPGNYVIERGERSVAALLGPSFAGRVDEVLYSAAESATSVAARSHPIEVASEDGGTADRSRGFEDDADPATDAPAAEPAAPAIEDSWRRQTASSAPIAGDAPREETASSAADPSSASGSQTASAAAADPVAPAQASAADPAPEVEIVSPHPVAAESRHEVEIVADEPRVHPVAERLARVDDPAPRASRSDRTPTDADLDALAAGEPTAYALPVRATSKSASRTSVSTAGEPYLPSTDRGPHEYTGQKISLDFKDADIQNVLRILADVSGLNIITTEDVAGKLTMRLVDVPWDQALESIMRAKGLDMVREGNIIRVSTVEQLKKERDAQRAADEAQKQVEPLGVRYVKINYAKADEALVKKVQEVLTDRGSATWDERTNTIVVRDIARGLDDAAELIRALRHPDAAGADRVEHRRGAGELPARPRHPVGLQLPRRAGDRERDRRQLPRAASPPAACSSGGTNSPANPAVPFIADFPAAIAPGAGTAYDVLLGSLDGTNSLAARLTALETKRKGKIISRPRVVTLNNVPAKIESVVIVRIKTPASGTVLNNATGSAGVAGSSAQAAFQEFRTGIILNVTPQVSSDGYIFLDVHAKSSNLEGAQTDPGIIPNEISREAESHVLIKDGETFVLGGIFRNILNRSDRGIPFLHSIPVLGMGLQEQRGRRGPPGAARLHHAAHHTDAPERRRREPSVRAIAMAKSRESLSHSSGALTSPGGRGATRHPSSTAFGAITRAAFLDRW